MMREKIIDQCLQVMKRDDVKRELKQLFHPVIDLIMQEIYPYIYLSVIFVLISFLLTLGIFVLLMRTSFQGRLMCDWFDLIHVSQATDIFYSIIGWASSYVNKIIKDHNWVGHD